MEGFPRCARSPAGGIVKQALKRASRLHASRAVRAVVRDAGAVGEQHAHGHGNVQRMRMADGITEVFADIAVKAKLPAFAKGECAEGHHELGNRGDAHAGIRRDRR